MMRRDGRVGGGSLRALGMVVVGLGVVSGCDGGDPGLPDAGPACEQFASAAPAARLTRTLDGFTLFADAPASIQADSASYVVTDGAVEMRGEVAAEESIRVDVVAAIEAPWTATVTYRRAGCEDRTVVHDLDLTPPPPVSDPSATGGTYSVTLGWTPPSDADFERVGIYMKVGSAPTGFDDPDAVGLCNVIGSGMVVDCGAPPSQWFGIPAGDVYFTIYAIDSTGNASEGVTTNATVDGVDAWRTVAACDAGAYGIASDGTLWGWGDVVGRSGQYSQVSPVQFGTESDWERVDCGLLHAVALDAAGTLYGWGPAAASSLAPMPIGAASDWTEIASGRDHILAIRSPGTLWAWGANQRGQLGDGTTTLREEPVQVGTDSDWSTVSAGATHSLAIKQDGSLWGFGGSYGSTPVRIGDGNDWSAVAAGYSESFGIRGGGTLWKWGTSEVSQPEQIGTNGDWTSVSANFDGIAVRADGSLWIIPFGGTEPMQLGAGISWAAASAGAMFYQALTTDGARYAWGVNTRGTVGDGSFVDRAEPTLIP